MSGCRLPPIPIGIVTIAASTAYLLMAQSNCAMKTPEEGRDQVEQSRASKPHERAGLVVTRSSAVTPANATYLQRLPLQDVYHVSTSRSQPPCRVVNDRDCQQVILCNQPRDLFLSRGVDGYHLGNHDSLQLRRGCVVSSFLD